MNRRTFLTINLYALISSGFAYLKHNSPKSAIADTISLQPEVSTYGSGIYGSGVYVGQQPQNLADGTSQPISKAYLPMMVGDGN